MMRSMVHREANSSSDESTADLFSPVHGRRSSLHDDFDDTPDSPGTPAADGADSLPRLADNSWIGARVSPIPSVDEEDARADDFELDRVTAPYHKAMQDFGANERSALLGRRIHPMWNGDEYDEAARISADLLNSRNQQGRKRPHRQIWGKAVVGASALHIFCIGLHDIFLWYLQMRRDVYSQYSLAWSIPWMGPSARVLLRFGAYSPGKILWQRQWYRALTSLTLTASLSEWIVMVVGWWQLENITASATSTTKWRIWWPVIFILSVGTGQLWMAAFGSYYSLSGCAGWGTCGVLCATGVSRPDHRLPLFLTAIGLVILNVLQSTSNVFGAIGASFFGWSFSGIGLVDISFSAFVKENDSLTRRWHCLNWLALVTTVTLWVIPILYILIWKERSDPPDFDSSYASSSNANQ
jgi:hypothetical protein